MSELNEWTALQAVAERFAIENVSTKTTTFRRTGDVMRVVIDGVTYQAKVGIVADLVAEAPPPRRITPVPEIPDGRYPDPLDEREPDPPVATPEPNRGATAYSERDAYYVFVHSRKWYFAYVRWANTNRFTMSHAENILSLPRDDGRLVRPSIANWKKKKTFAKVELRLSARDYYTMASRMGVSPDRFIITDTRKSPGRSVQPLPPEEEDNA